MSEHKKKFVGAGSDLWETVGRKRETTMAIVQKLSGVAVLLLTLHFTHLLHHAYAEWRHDSSYFWAGMAAGVVVWVFSLIGGVLLLKRSR